AEGGLLASPEIDYDRYAEGEASLAWCDGRFGLSAAERVDMDTSLLGLGVLLTAGATAADMDIAHVKLLLSAAGPISIVNIARSSGPPELSQSAEAYASSLELTINARVAARPEQLQSLVENCLDRWAQQHAISLVPRSLASFSPARPTPTCRMP
ncbi:MAG: hypothetical protein M3Z31_18105, partial [Pseudomonadota bacterium]|nr:hypothetical protein [Pseudomonadota bacterium]